MHRPQGGTDDGEVGERRRPHHMMGVGWSGLRTMDNSGGEGEGKVEEASQG